MKKVIYMFLVACFSATTLSFGQDFQGVAVYESKTSMDMDFGGRNMSEDQIKMIKERMKKAFEKTFELNFTRTESLYKEQETLEAPGGGPGGMRFGMMGAGDGIYYKNTKNKSYTSERETFGKIFLVQDTLGKLDWKLGSETKQIGKYTCYKATAVPVVKETAMLKMAKEAEEKRKAEQAKDSTANEERGGRRSFFSSFTENQNKEIVAWYTPEIPVSNGPGEYWGLPGLILEVSAGNTAILCSKIIINPKDKIEIEAPKKGKVVSQEEYDEIMADKMKEMQERFRGGNRSRGGSTIRIRN